MKESKEGAARDTDAEDAAEDSDGPGPDPGRAHGSSGVHKYPDIESLTMSDIGSLAALDAGEPMPGLLIATLVLSARGADVNVRALLVIADRR